MERVILHCDLNGFYASVECLLQPELRHVPMAVAGSQDNRHGIILAKNELAKKAGVVTAETIWQARKKCPDLVLTPPQHHLYHKYSRMANDIYGRFTDQIEPFGIDESWLDVTASQKLFGNGEEIANTIRQTMKDELGLTVSVGVSFNKVFAKLGSDYKKPDATTVISRENYRDIVYPLPVNALLYVGDTVQQTLAKLGVQTIGQLAAMPLGTLRNQLGKAADALHSYATGEENSPVDATSREAKSVGNGMTFRRNLTSDADIRLGLLMLSDEVASRLRQHGYKCHTVQLQIKDPNLKVISRQKALDTPTNLAREIFETAYELVKANWKPGAPIRLFTVTGSNLVSEDSATEQLAFFEKDSWQRAKQEKLEGAMDIVRQKYGREALSFATQMETLDD